FDAVAPDVLLVTETNVPHAENISYFGADHDEAQMVYNFSLPPLLLDGVYTGSAKRLSDWAASLDLPRPGCAFFNITATHDGIGVRGAQDYMTPQEIDGLAEKTLARGGLVSYRQLSDGSQTPYELNITFFDALLPPGEDPDSDTAITRYMTAQSVALALRGVPGIYFHNLLGSRSDHAALEGKDATQTEFKRVTNRKRLTLAEIEATLADVSGRGRRVFDAYCRRLKVWRETPEFAPDSPQTVLALDDRVLAIRRGETLYCLHNLSGDSVTVERPAAGALNDILSGDTLPDGPVRLGPWAMAWLKAE
ncbi:MAG: hypothetical protein KDJ77_17695, partial [Rhodobiaceae bacterium]|nr:hypothetical protein [Rhodobiaceae bacterium]